MATNTIFLRLEGPLQAWGNHEAQFAVRRSAEMPTRSGVFGILCACLGVSRIQASEKWLPDLNKLKMGVRIDSPGFFIWDYHTVGAGQRMIIADSKTPENLSLVGESYPLPAKYKTKGETMLSRREYLADASFLVALQGEPEIISELAKAIKKPVWAPFLGRKSCPPSRPIHEPGVGDFPNLLSALGSVPWRVRPEMQNFSGFLPCYLDWIPEHDGDLAPADVQIFHDVPLSFSPPRHLPRFVMKALLACPDLQKTIDSTVSWKPPRHQAGYLEKDYRKIRQQRMEMDHGLCVFCKEPGTTVQHVTYAHAGGNESLDELRTLCTLCHDAITMLEYGFGMTTERINPENPKYRTAILEKRREIIQFRSLAQRERALQEKESD